MHHLAAVDNLAPPLAMHMEWHSTPRATWTRWQCEIGCKTADRINHARGGAAEVGGKHEGLNTVTGSRGWGNPLREGREKVDEWGRI